MMRIDAIDLHRYDPLEGIRLDFEDDLTVVAGDNESGKSMLIEAMLQLLDPKLGSGMQPPRRGQRDPTGVVECRIGDDALLCDGESVSLGDAIDLEAQYLDSIFVVRDADLSLTEDPDGYYGSIADMLGNVQLDEIEAIDARLKEVGRLTPTNLKLTSKQDLGAPKTVVADLTGCIGRIDEYLHRAEQDGLQDLEADLLDADRAFTDAEAALEEAIIEDRLAAYEVGMDLVGEYREHNSVVDDLSEFGDRFPDLQELDVDRERVEGELRTASKALEDLEDERTNLSDRVDDLADRVDAAESREQDVNELEQELEALSEVQSSGGVDDDLGGLYRQVAPTALIAAAVAIGVGVITGAQILYLAGLLLTVIGGVSLYAYRRLNRRDARRARAGDAVVSGAQELGFDVETPGEVRVAIAEFRTNLERDREQRDQSKGELRGVNRAVDKKRSEVDDLESKLEQLREDVQRGCAALGEEDVVAARVQFETWDAAIEVRNDLSNELSGLIGTPPDDVSPAKFWECTLREDVDDIDTSADSITPRRHDDLGELEQARDARGEELQELQSQLEEHEQMIQSFDEDVLQIDVGPFTESKPRLQSDTLVGAEELRDELVTIRDQIELDAEIARKAVGCFESIWEDERDKLGTVFSEGGPASQHFNRLTDGRYEGVRYDAEAGSIVVTDADGEELEASLLSQGTADQLYFASRLSLADRLLDGPGFLILEDAFMAADPGRFREGMRLLEELTEDGWQCIYFTAKSEVREYCEEVGHPVMTMPE